MTTDDGMLEWAGDPDGARKALIRVGNRIGWIEVREVLTTDGNRTGTFNVTATVAVGAVGGAAGALNEALNQVQIWVDEICAEPLPKK